MHRLNPEWNFPLRTWTLEIWAQTWTRGFSDSTPPLVRTAPLKVHRDSRHYVPSRPVWAAGHHTEQESWANPEPQSPVHPSVLTSELNQGAAHKGAKFFTSFRHFQKKSTFEICFYYTSCSLHQYTNNYPFVILTICGWDLSQCIHLNLKSLSSHLASCLLKCSFDVLPLFIGPLHKNFNDGVLIYTWEQPNTGSNT